MIVPSSVIYRSVLFCFFLAGSKPAKEEAAPSKDRKSVSTEERKKSVSKEEKKV